LLGSLFLLAALMLTACTTPATTGATTTKATTTGTTATTTTTQAGYPHDPNLNDPGVIPICKEKVTLKVGIRENANVVDFATNTMTKLIEEQGNMKLEFVYYSAEMATQINLVVAGGDFKSMPDILMLSPGDAYVYQWGLAGAIIPVNEYYENSAFHLNIAEERTGVDFKRMITSPDGNYYGIPTFNQSLGNENPAKMWIYKPWLDKLSLPVPQTTADFLNVLKAFKTGDPNGNGQPDEIPLLGLPYTNITIAWMQALVAPFQFIGAGHYVVNDGKIGTWYNTAAYRESLQYIRSLFAEGVIPDFQFTIDRTGYNNLASNAEIPLLGVIIDGSSAIAGAIPGRVPEYVGFGPLKNPDGRHYTAFVPSVANISFMITAACAKPETAFRLGDLLVSEDLSIITRWGTEGKHWDYVKNSKKDMSQMDAWFEKAGYPGYIVIYDDPWGIVQNDHWYQAGPFIRQYGIAAGRVVPKDTPIQSEYMIAQVIGSYLDVSAATSRQHAVGKLVFNSTELSAITEILNSIEAAVKENTAKFCLGQLDINSDAAWNEYVKQLDTIGLQSVLKIVQNVYDRMYK
jgi:putative aldouronate transport system substrate-binding protein